MLINNPPAGMTISAGGLLQWTPTEDEVGQPTIWVMASDPYGNLDVVSFDLVVHDDEKPALSTDGYHEPILQAGQTFSYQPSLAFDTDGDSDPVTWSVALVDGNNNALPPPPGLTAC